MDEKKKVNSAKKEFFKHLESFSILRSSMNWKQEKLRYADLIDAAATILDYSEENNLNVKLKDLEKLWTEMNEEFNRKFTN